MIDLIDRQELILWLSKDPLFPQVESFGLTNVIKSRPRIDAEPVKHGHWIFNPKDAIEMMFTLPKCSLCGAESPNGGNYCSNCGAKMDDDWEEPEINPCRGCVDYDGRGGCKSNGGCGTKMEMTK